MQKLKRRFLFWHFGGWFGIAALWHRFSMKAVYKGLPNGGDLSKTKMKDCLEGAKEYLAIRRIPGKSSHKPVNCLSVLFIKKYLIWGVLFILSENLNIKVIEIINCEKEE